MRAGPPPLEKPFLLPPLLPASLDIIIIIVIIKKKKETTRRFARHTAGSATSRIVHGSTLSPPPQLRGYDPRQD